LVTLHLGAMYLGFLASWDPRPWLLEIQDLGNVETPEMRYLHQYWVKSPVWTKMSAWGQSLWTLERIECESDIATTDIVEYGSDFTAGIWWQQRQCFGKELMVCCNDKANEWIDDKGRLKTVEAELEWRDSSSALWFVEWLIGWSIFWISRKQSRISLFAHKIVLRDNYISRLPKPEIKIKISGAIHCKLGRKGIFRNGRLCKFPN